MLLHVYILQVFFLIERQKNTTEFIKLITKIIYKVHQKFNTYNFN